MKNLARLMMLVGALAGTVATAHADTPKVVTGALPAKLTFNTYLTEVASANLGVIAQKANVSIAQAQIAIARVFPDPSITAGLLQYDLAKSGQPTATIVALNVPIQLGGKRDARIDLAEKTWSSVQADLDDYLRQLRGQASDAYIEGLHTRLIADRKKRTLASLEELVEINKERLKAGDVGEAALIQSRVEAEQFHAEVVGAEGEVRAADLAMLLLLGRKIEDKPLTVEGDLRVPPKAFDAKALAQKALELRPDLIAVRRRSAGAKSAIDLAKANRVIDVAVGATWQHNFGVGEPPLPPSNFVGLTLTVPLPFSRVYKGELEAAYAASVQADALVKAAEARVELEVKQAIVKYEAAAAKVKIYNGGVLADSETVLERVLYNFRHGGARLVEVLVAQRTVDEVYIAYYEALAAAAHALVAVHQASATPGPEL